MRQINKCTLPESSHTTGMNVLCVFPHCNADHCIQRWARSAGNSAIENVCIIILFLLFLHTQTVHWTFYYCGQYSQEYNFIAKCQYTDCTRNVLWCQVHSHTFTPIIKHLITTTANKHPSKTPSINLTHSQLQHDGG